MKKYSVLGMMSGTSLDGLDIAHCTIWYDQQWKFTINNATTISYSKDWKARLKDAIHLSGEDHQLLHLTYGEWLGKQAKQFIDQENISVDFIASHGHTSHHKPEEGFTFQLGDGQRLTNVSGQKVVCDFRTYDVKLGGQGAPLVPIGDKLFFSDYDFCLNLGGISNISFEMDNKRIAYDIGMANMPLNYITAKIGMEYDQDGQMARSGKIVPKLMEQLNALEYYKLPYPKSTGYEWFVAKIIPLIDGSNAIIEDLLHTMIHHNCGQIALEVKKQNNAKQNKMLVCGGGALNSFFVETIKTKLQGYCDVIIPEKRLINFKEALVFSLMGVLKAEGKTNVLSSVTGARSDSSSGTMYHPD